MAVVKSAPLKKTDTDTSESSSEKKQTSSSSKNAFSSKARTGSSSSSSNLLGENAIATSPLKTTSASSGSKADTSKAAGSYSKVKIDTTGMDDADKYILATSEADSLLGDIDSNKSEIASRLNKSEGDVDKMSTEDIQKGVIDSIFENDLQSEQTGREVRGENWFTDAVGGAKNAINSFNTMIGNGLDAASDAVIGGLVGLVAGDDAAQGYRDAVTGEDLAFIPDIAEDVAISLIPGAGIPLVVGKNAIQNSDEIVSGITGRDPVTQQAVDNQALNAFLGFGGTALAALPGAGKAVNVVRGARKAGKAAQEATEAANKALEGGATKVVQETVPASDEAKLLYQGLKTGVANPGYTTAIPEEQIPKDLISAANSGDEVAQVKLAELRNGISTGGVGLSEEEIPEALKVATEDTTRDVRKAVTTDEALDSIIADVDRSASSEDQIKQIQKMLNNISTEGGASEETAESIYNAMAAADQANSLSAISALNPSVSRFAERGFGGSLLNNARNAITPKQVRAMQSRTVDRNGKIRGNTTEKDILESTGLSKEEIGKLTEKQKEQALSRAGRQQFKNALHGTDITGAPAVNESQQAAINLGGERLNKLASDVNYYGGGKNGVRMRINRAANHQSKASSAAEQDAERLKDLLGQKKLSSEEGEEVTRLLGNAEALPQTTQAAVQGMSPGLLKRMGGYAGRMGMNNAVSIASGAAAENEDPITYLEDLATAATEGDFSRVIQPMLSTFIPTGKKLGTSPTGIPGAIRPSSVNSAYQISSMNTQGPINSSDNTQRGRTLTTDDYLDYLQTSLQDLPAEA